jgi:hypothetical protein
MKKIIIAIILLTQFSAFARAGAGGTGYIANFGTNPLAMGVGVMGPGVVVGREALWKEIEKISECPGSFDIGNFDLRSTEMPTSFEGTFGGRF